ncbi:WD40 repeat domain-containing serine/threonine protein kinase [Streptomyces sp. NPDC059957]|uniref:WD40 repeat domain-containing serine/threonine protein kinase n=1 Tax=Streptomyces sp. NPDC059957 TaxID=3347016 RepID=UPI00364B0C01
MVAGRYRLVELLGQGGMGRVWRAWDETLRRDVAIKEVLVPLGLDDAQRNLIVGRVMREARAAARLSHPHIITVHDAVEHHGAPLIVMELIAGRSLATEIRERGPLPVRKVMAIGAAVADALAAAHAAGVVHRDVKPDNVLLSGGRVVLTDFGIAGVADATVTLTSTGTVIGTPAYLSPEQLEGKAVGPASDMWSLGVTLYAAVEGVPPFRADTLTALYVAILTQEIPVADGAGVLAPVLTGLLIRDPARRATVHDVAAALSGLDRAVSPTAAGTEELPEVFRAPAGPPSTIREPVVAAGRPTETEEPPETRDPGRPLNQRRGVLLAGLGIAAVAAGGMPLGVHLMQSRSEGDSPSRSGPSLPAPSQSWWSEKLDTKGFRSMAFSPDGKTLAGGQGPDGGVEIWDVASRQRTAVFSGHTHQVFAVMFSADGRTLLSASQDTTIRLWETATGRPLTKLTGSDGTVWSAALSPNGSTVVSSSSQGGCVIWDISTGMMKRTLQDSVNWNMPLVAFLPDGSTIAGANGVFARLWDAGSGKTIATLKQPAVIETMALSPDGRILAVGCEDNTVRLLDLTTRQTIATLAGHTKKPSAVAFSPDGKALASGSWDTHAKLWNVTSGENTATIDGHAEYITSVVFSPSGKYLATASAAPDNAVQIWQFS